MSPDRIREIVLSCWYPVGPDHIKGNPAADTDDMKIEAAIKTAINEALEAAAAICDEAADLHSNGERWIDASEFCASEIREAKLKP